MKTCDLAIIGAGPAGLYAAYYAGFRGFSSIVLDALPEAGGQVTAMYPEKSIFDVAGFPEVKGRDLVDGLLRQCAPYRNEFALGERVVSLRHEEQSVVLGCESGLEVEAKAVLITGGIGSFSPRPLPTGMEWLGRGLVHFVPRLADHAGKRVVIVGGGDSAFDWALALAPIAASVTLVHRRDEFRAHAATVDQVRGLGVRLITSAEIAAVDGENAVQSVTVKYKADGVEEVLEAETVVAALGFIANIGPISEWGLELEKRKIAVDTSMATNLPRVYAAGDIATYPGKVPLIAVGFGEAATAVNNAAPSIDPALGTFPGHSSGGSGE